MRTLPLPHSTISTQRARDIWHGQLAGDAGERDADSGQRQQAADSESRDMKQVILSSSPPPPTL